MRTDDKETIANLKVGDLFGPTRWVTVTQEMIDGFATATLDRDPMHVDPEWARKGPFAGTISFGFLTMSLLTHMLHEALETPSDRDPRVFGYFLNYGFDRVRLVAPVPSGARVRGRFQVARNACDERGRRIMTMACTIEIENAERPAMVADWLSMWVPPEAD